MEIPVESSDCAHDKPQDKVFCSPEKVVGQLKTMAAEHDEGALLEKLKKKYHCSDEVCVLKSAEVLDAGSAESVIREYFKPTGPKKGSAWLSNFNIDSVLDQIEKKHPEKKFLHITYQMIDFAKTGTDLATLDWLAKYEQGYRTFGTIINTDTSHGKGIHWFALFGDFTDGADPFTVEYFNSSGELPMDEILVWMKKMTQLKMAKPIKDIVATRIINQSDNHSCGPYSLYYIMSRLDGVPYAYFKNNKIGDQKMHKFRGYLFREG